LAYGTMGRCTSRKKEKPSFYKKSGRKERPEPEENSIIFGGTGKKRCPVKCRAEK